MITKYANFGDDQLEAKADAVAAHSPLIAELLTRWLARLDVTAMHHRASCPCCEANLNIEPDESNERYIVTIDKN